MGPDEPCGCNAAEREGMLPGLPAAAAECGGPASPHTRELCLAVSARLPKALLWGVTRTNERKDPFSALHKCLVCSLWISRNGVPLNRHSEGTPPECSHRLAFQRQKSLCALEVSASAPRS